MKTEKRTARVYVISRTPQPKRGEVINFRKSEAKQWSEFKFGNYWLLWSTQKEITEAYRLQLEEEYKEPIYLWCIGMDSLDRLFNSVQWWWITKQNMELVRYQGKIQPIKALIDSPEGKACLRDPDFTNRTIHQILELVQEIKVHRAFLRNGWELGDQAPTDQVIDEVEWYEEFTPNLKFIQQNRYLNMLDRMDRAFEKSLRTNPEYIDDPIRRYFTSEEYFIGMQCTLVVDSLTDWSKEMIDANFLTSISAQCDDHSDIRIRLSNLGVTDQNAETNTIVLSDKNDKSYTSKEILKYLYMIWTITEVEGFICDFFDVQKELWSYVSIQQIKELQFTIYGPNDIEGLADTKYIQFTKDRTEDGFCLRCTLTEQALQHVNEKLATNDPEIEEHMRSLYTRY